MTRAEQDRRIDLLVSTLRSGKYNQARYELQSSDNCYCVMGVACKVAESEGVKVDRNTSNSLLTGATLDDHLAVKEWYGFKNGAGSMILTPERKQAAMQYGFSMPLYSQKVKVILMTLNDRDLFHLNFKDLADIIDEFRPELFNLIGESNE